MLFSNDKDQLRRFYCEAWARHQRGEPLDPLAQQVATVIQEHPEYHALLMNTQAVLEADFDAHSGQSNPFLHMGLHLAIREQVSTDRPSGIFTAYQSLARKHGPLEAEHRIMECLGQALWQAQRNGTAPDETAYLDCVLGLRAD